MTKHAVRTVIETLGPRDRLSLVAFDAVARRVFDGVAMDAAGKARAAAELEKLRPGSTTNLWGGLENGLQMLKAAEVWEEWAGFVGVLAVVWIGHSS